MSKLSQLLGRAKSTITHHIKKLESLGIIKSTRKEARGSIDAKVYELIPGFLEKFSLESDQISLDKKESREFLSDAILNDLLFFKIIRILFEQAILYYEAIISKNLKSKSKSFKDFQSSHFKIPLNYDFWFLSEKGRKSYEDLIKEFNNKLNGIINQDNKENKEAMRPYLILNSFFPLLQIIEYDSELKEFRKFFEALE